MFRAASRLAIAGAVWLIRQYQRWLSPLLGKQCRYYPTCSEYTRQAIEKYGVVIGCAKGAWRILRCNPFCRGGVDLP